MVKIGERGKRNGLSTKQRRFAALVAAGKTQEAAYVDAGYSGRGTKATTKTQARKLAQKEDIQTLVEQLRGEVAREMLNGAADMEQVYIQGLGTIVELAKSYPEGRVRLDAAKWLCEEARRVKAGEEKARQEERKRKAGSEEIVAELRTLYRRAIPAQVEQAGDAEQVIEALVEPAEIEGGDSSE